MGKTKTFRKHKTFRKTKRNYNTKKHFRKIKGGNNEFLNAVRRHNWDDALKELDVPNVDVDVIDDKRKTAFEHIMTYKAAWKGKEGIKRKELALKLIEKGVDINQIFTDGTTALEHASCVNKNWDFDIAKKLLEYNANPYYVPCFNEFDRRIRHYSPADSTIGHRSIKELFNKTWLYDNSDRPNFAPLEKYIFESRDDYWDNDKNNFNLHNKPLYQLIQNRQRIGNRYVFKNIRNLIILDKPNLFLAFLQYIKTKFPSLDLSEITDETGKKIIHYITMIKSKKTCEFLKNYNEFEEFGPKIIARILSNLVLSKSKKEMIVQLINFAKKKHNVDNILDIKDTENRTILHFLASMEDGNGNVIKELMKLIDEQTPPSTIFSQLSINDSLK